MAAQTVDMLRSPVQPMSDMTEALSLLHEIALNLSRLVELEEERREGERQMEALAEALTPPVSGNPLISDAVPIDVDWYRDGNGNWFWRHADGTTQPMAPAEIKAVTTPSRQR
jgi:hypothetical protein